MTAKRKRRRVTPEFKAKVVLEALNVETSQAELCRRHNITEVQLSKQKRQLLENATTLFKPADKQSDASTERIAHLEQLADKLTQAVDIHQKVLGEIRRNTQAKTPQVKHWIALNRSEE